MKKQTKQTREKRQEERREYGAFYSKHAHNARNKLCDNCGRRLRGHVSEIAHWLPKSVFKSIATEDDAVMYLCSYYSSPNGRGCHEEYDSGWETAIKMKVWKKVEKRYEKIKHLITESSLILNKYFIK